MNIANYTMVITNSDLNRQASAEANLLRVEVWDRERLIKEFNNLNKDIHGERHAEMAVALEHCTGPVIKITSQGH